jgi:hypothetical protein
MHVYSYKQSEIEPLRDVNLLDDQDIVKDLLKAFLGNGTVNTFQRATMEDVSQWTNIIARC